MHSFTRKNATCNMNLETPQPLGGGILERRHGDAGNQSLRRIESNNVALTRTNLCHCAQSVPGSGVRYKELYPRLGRPCCLSDFLSILVSCSPKRYYNQPGYISLIMAEKAYVTDTGVEHNEKNPPEYHESAARPADNSGRRASVALNIVENPLRVSKQASKLTPSMPSRVLDMTRHDKTKTD